MMFQFAKCKRLPEGTKQYVSHALSGVGFHVLYITQAVFGDSIQTTNTAELLTPAAGRLGPSVKIMLFIFVCWIIEKPSNVCLQLKCKWLFMNFLLVLWVSLSENRKCSQNPMVNVIIPSFHIPVKMAEKKSWLWFLHISGETLERILQ